MVGSSFQDQGGRGRRKSSRRRFAYPAQIYSGSSSPPDPCVIVDISELGAKLSVPAGTDIPDEFSLLIGGHADVRRLCRVVWRSSTGIGVRFQDEPQRVPQQVQQQDLLGIVLRSHGPAVPKKKA
jgi:hypothetical protein